MISLADRMIANINRQGVCNFHLLISTIKCWTSSFLHPTQTYSPLFTVFTDVNCSRTGVRQNLHIVGKYRFLATEVQNGLEVFHTSTTECHGPLCFLPTNVSEYNVSEIEIPIILNKLCSSISWLVVSTPSCSFPKILSV